MVVGGGIVGISGAVEAAEAGRDVVPEIGDGNRRGGSVSVMSPDKTLHLIKQILDAAAAAGADVIATPCPLCQTNVEMYQDAINKKFGTNHRIPVVFYSQLMAVAFGMDAKRDAALDRNTIPAKMLVDMAKG